MELGRLARDNRARAEAGRFVLDGPVLLAEALAAGVVVEAAYVDPDALDRPEVAAALAAAEAAAVPCWAVAGGLRGHVEVTTPHGLAAVARIPGAAPAGEGGGPVLHIVLVGVADPGNAGTLLRTAEAVGATSVVLTDGSVDPWSPKVVRASAGSVLRVPIRRGPAAAVLAELAAAGVRTVGTRARDGAPPDRVDLAGPVALVLGSEAHGLPDEVAAAVDAWASLPMRGRVESLNVAVAGSVLAFEVVRQRSRTGAGRAATMDP
ncbi:MAG TPA: RNA methyltransferase [Acidimicrobiales bacterium]|nr:RNA methyltransferase [Acidimicrobiales bacterium]